VPDERRDDSNTFSPPPFTPYRERASGKALAFVGTNATDEPITSGWSVIQADHLVSAVRHLYYDNFGLFQAASTTDRVGAESDETDYAVAIRDRAARAIPFSTRRPSSCEPVSNCAPG
jgi:hypothetical protein